MNLLVRNLSRLLDEIKNFSRKTCQYIMPGKICQKGGAHSSWVHFVESAFCTWRGLREGPRNSAADRAFLRSREQMRRISVRFGGGPCPWQTSSWVALLKASYTISRVKKRPSRSAYGERMLTGCTWHYLNFLKSNYLICDFAIFCKLCTNSGMVSSSLYSMRGLPFRF